VAALRQLITHKEYCAVFVLTNIRNLFEITNKNCSSCPSQLPDGFPAHVGDAIFERVLEQARLLASG
jgi:hypothetical protein